MAQEPVRVLVTGAAGTVTKPKEEKYQSHSLSFPQIYNGLAWFDARLWNIIDLDLTDIDLVYLVMIKRDYQVCDANRLSFESEISWFSYYYSLRDDRLLFDAKLF